MIIYYTDGSCSPNPGPGGFAVIKDMKPHILGAKTSGNITTNIRMEGYAIIAALKDASGQPCKIHTDSELWIKIITEWSNKWRANGWQKKGGIKNIDIVKEVCELYLTSKAELIWVLGHNSDPGNELADKYANIAREQQLNY